MDFKIKIPIGDWSDDGHGKYRIYTIESNYPAYELQEAYKASCKLTGIQFNHNENYMGIPFDNERLICTEYQDCGISDFAQETLKEHGIDVDEISDEGYLGTKDFTELLLAFIGLSMPKDWEWKFSEDGEYLNGFWNDNLNVQFGYGLFE